MTYQVLARKWRPKCFADLVGQEHVVRALKNALIDARLHHAYLLTGTRGVGKTTIARILAKSLNCEQGIGAEPCGQCAACCQIDTGRFVDLLEIDAASNTGIDNIREVLENAQYAPSLGRFKVYIIDEVHMLSKSAFNAMLKTLEEPPAHVKFILATTDPQKVPVTVLSRCLQFNLRPMTPQQVAEHLGHVLTQESVVFEDEALSLLGRAAAGSMRDALSLLDQAIAYGMGEVREEGVRAMLGVVDRRYLFVLAEALAQADGPRLMQEAQRLAEHSIGFEAALAEMALLWHQVALMQTVPDAITDDEPEREMLVQLAAGIAPEDVQLYYQIALHGRRDLALAPDEFAGFTMTLLRMLAFHPKNADERGGVTSSTPSFHGMVSMPAGNLPGSVAAKDLLLQLGERASSVRPERSGAAAASSVDVPAPSLPPPVAEVSAQQPVLPGDSNRRVSLREQEVPDEPAKTSQPMLSEDDWITLIGELGPRMGAARMLAQNAVLKSFDGRHLALAVSSDFRHLAARDYQEKLKSVLAERFGDTFLVTVSIEALDGETPAKRDARDRQAQMAAARQALETDTVVQQFVRDFDAKLITDSIQPI